MRIDRSRNPLTRSHSYYEYIFPVLLDELRNSWQIDELSQLITKLEINDKDRVLRKTLKRYFFHNARMLDTAKYLNIHRNTLDYRLKRAEKITGLNMQQVDDILLLYIVLLLDNDIADDS